jgi:hypothetical protein
MIKRTTIYLLTIVGVITTQSCVDLKHINSFSKSSIEALKKHEEITYTATKYCNHICANKNAIASSKAKDDTTFEQKLDRVKVNNDTDCNCDEATKADNCLDTYRTILIAYFNGLAKLSDKKATNTSFNNLTTSTKDLVKNNKLNITDGDIDAAGSLAKFITEAFLEGYRQNKLKDAIDKADDPLGKVIDAYARSLDELEHVVESDRKELRRFYKDKYDNDSNENNVAKYLEEYATRDAELKKQSRLIETFKSTLPAIKAGHNKLKKESGNLSEKTLASDLNEYTQSIISLYNTFNNLKK